MMSTPLYMCIYNRRSVFFVHRICCPYAAELLTTGRIDIRLIAGHRVKRRTARRGKLEHKIIIQKTIILLKYQICSREMCRNVQHLQPNTSAVPCGIRMR